MANLQRQDARRDRLLGSPTRGNNTATVQPAIVLPPAIQHNDNVQFFKSNMPPFLKKIMTEMSVKHAKIKCSLQHLNSKLESLNEIMAGQDLPPEFKFQQKYFDSLSNLEMKSVFVKNLIDNKKTIMKQRITDLTAKYEARTTELKSLIDPFNEKNSGSNFLTGCKINWAKALDSFIQIEICTMVAKANQDLTAKEQKREKFLQKKEEYSKPKVLTVGDYEKLTSQLKSLKIKNNSQKTNKNSKNSKGEKTAGKGPSPKKTLNKKKDQTKGKNSQKKKGNGSTKGTATVRK